MADFFMDALFALVADDAEFFASDFGLDDFGLNLGSDWGADGGLVAINDEVGVEIELFGALGQEVNRDGIALCGEVLMAENFDDCFFTHRVSIAQLREKCKPRWFC